MISLFRFSFIVTIVEIIHYAIHFPFRKTGKKKKRPTRGRPVTSHTEKSRAARVEYAKRTLVREAIDALESRGISSALLATALESKAAREQIPELAVTRCASKIRQNITSLVQDLPPVSRFKTSMVASVTRGLSAERAAKAVGLSARQIRNHRSASLTNVKERERTNTRDPLFSEAHQHGTLRVRVPELEVACTVRWTKARMHVVSGTTAERYTLVGTKQDMYLAYREAYIDSILKPLVTHS